ncbi:Tetratricopeptide repeat-containing protein [Chryseolinea serpens]|uniref:histidine kinase n=1 Tax=Chryseolinea serpens TaxID=947013 RepID=A0A1M5MV67_9BACT|nr:Tetratricopeptide repeat-containing protein [Chryseolinea serpens]
MNSRFIAIITFCVFILSEGSAQQHVLDSLKTEIDKRQQRDSFRVKAILEYVVEALNNNTSDFLPYMNEVISISKKTNYKRGLQKGFMIGQIYFSDRGDYEKAFLYADSAFSALKNDTSLKARQSTGHLYNNIAGDYFKLGDYEKAIDNFTLSARIFEPMDHPFLATVYSNLAEIYEKIHDASKAIEYDKKAIAIAEKSQNDRSLAARLLNYSMRLINQKAFTQAAPVLKRAEPIIMKLENTSYLQQFYYTGAYLDENNKDYHKAVAHYKKALGYATLNEDVYQKTNILEALSDCLIRMNRMKEAKSYLDTLLLLSNGHDLKAARRNAYVNLVKWHEQNGDYKNANLYLQKTLALNDSLFSEESKEKIAGLEVRYNVEKKEQEINGLKAEANIQSLTIRQKNTLNYILIGGAITLLIISSLSYRSYKQKQKLQQQRITELETEKQLSAIEAVLKGEEQERTRLAKDLHDGLGGMLSGIKYAFSAMKGNLIMTPENHQAFERSMDMLDSSILEMRRVAHNMMPEALVKFGLDTALKDYCHDINQSGALHVSYQSIGLANGNPAQTVAITIYRIVQELITNTLKHAGAKTAIIQVTETEGILSVTVEDDGKGFDARILERSKGMGWTSIQHRVDFLKGKLDIHSAPDKGTSVYIEFNV